MGYLVATNNVGIGAAIQQIWQDNFAPRIVSDDSGISVGFGRSMIKPADGLTTENAIAVGEIGLTVLTAGESKALTSGRTTISAKVLSNIPCKCFVAGTLIHTKNGLIPIEKIQVGDWVAARSDETSETAYKQVVRLVRDGEKEIIRLRYRLPNGKFEVLGVTEEHPFMLEGRRWINAGALKPGDKIMRLAGGVLTVVSMRHQVIKQHTFNFEVEGFHTYFAGIGGAWVHNAGPCDVVWKGFSKGSLADHFVKHGAEFGNITQNEYLKIAKAFSVEAGEFQLQKVGNFIVKHDPATGRTLVGHAGDREIRTFYKADGRSADPFQAAIDLARSLTR